MRPFNIFLGRKPVLKSYTGMHGTSVLVDKEPAVTVAVGSLNCMELRSDCSGFVEWDSGE